MSLVAARAQYCPRPHYAGLLFETSTDKIRAHFLTVQVMLQVAIVARIPPLASVNMSTSCLSAWDLSWSAPHLSPFTPSE